MLRIALGAALLGVAGMMQPATAAVVKATFSGQANAIVDQLGLFGMPGGAIPAGVASMTFVYDTERGSPMTFPGLVDARAGGGTSGVSNPVISASFTINGVTATAASGSSVIGMVATNPVPAAPNGFRISGQTDWSAPPASGAVFLRDFLAVLWSDSITAPASIGTPFGVANIGSLAGQPGAGYFAAMTFSRCQSGLFGCQDMPLGIALDSFRTEIVVPAPVPLPAGGLPLALAASGLGLLRRRRPAAS